MSKPLVLQALRCEWSSRRVKFVVIASVLSYTSHWKLNMVKKKKTVDLKTRIVTKYKDGL